MIDVTADKRVLEAEKLIGHIPGALPKAVSNAVNRAAEGSRTDAVKKTTEEYVIQAGRVRETITIRKANVSDLTASVTSRGRARALSYFKIKPGKPTKRKPAEGVYVQVKRSGGGPIAKAFVARMASGHLGVFNRVGASRFPILQRYGPPVAQMLGNQNVTRYVEDGANRRFGDRLDHEVSRILRSRA